MDIESVAKLAKKFGVSILSESPIAKQHNLFGDKIAFQLKGETVKHCLFDEEQHLVCFIPRWSRWQVGGYVEAIAIALSYGHRPEELLSTIREIENSLLEKTEVDATTAPTCENCGSLMLRAKDPKAERPYWFCLGCSETSGFVAR